MIEKSVNVILDSLLLKFLFDFCTLQLYIRQWHPTPAILPGKSHGQRDLVGCSPWGREESDLTEQFPFYFLLSALEKEMAIHCSNLAWKIPWMEEPDRLQSMRLQRVGQD